MISVLCPTRGRVELLRRSVASLIEHATPGCDFQMLYAVDADDVDTISFLQRDPTFIRPAMDRYYVSDERHGYGGFHVYANRLSQLAVGRWLMLWNDDAVMLTDDWNAIIHEWPESYVLSLRSNHAEGIVAFPVVPKRWVTALGHFSLNPHNDSWWQYLGECIGRIRWLDIDVLHDRFDITGNNDDQTYRDTRQQSEEARTADRFWNDAIPLIGEDSEVIQRILEEESAGAGNGK